jgi:hypothetical protein
MAIYVRVVDREQRLGATCSMDDFLWRLRGKYFENAVQTKMTR